VIEVNGQSLISIATPLAAASHWLLMITVPEAEFSGFIAVNARHGAEWSLSALVLALGLAVLLVRQGLRTDRADRAVADRAAALRGQAAAMARLSVEACQTDGNGPLPAGLTEAVAEATGARRVSIWRLPEGARALHCEDSFEPRTGGHVSGLEIAVQEVPQLLAAVGRGEEIETDDARRDRRCAPLLSALLSTPGAVRLLVVPLLRDGSARGLLLLEDPRLEAATRDLARAGAALLALRAPEQTAAAIVLPMARTLASTEQMMRVGGLAATALAQREPALCPDGTTRAALMVLRLPTDILNERAAPGAGGDRWTRRLVRTIEEAAQKHGLAYARMLGGTVVAAAGLAEQSDVALTDGASRLADAALAVREECLSLLAQTDETPAFRLGLDAGAIHVERVGDSPMAQNLWGEALRVAEILADTAPAGTIQVSEHMYRRLRTHFVLRPRGVFHLPGFGDVACYLLAGRA
jgi:adenylate cyclase